LLIAPLFFRKKLAVPFVIGGYLLLFTALLGAIFYWHTFPDCFVEGSGLTPFKIGSEYLICLIVLLAIFHLLRHRHTISPVTLKFLIASLVLTILAEFSFTLYFSVYGLSNMVGHYFKLLSFYCIYKALVRSGFKNPTELLFRNLEEKSKLYQELYDDAPVAYFSVGIDGAIRKANRKAAELLGLSRDELLGCQIFDFYADGPEGREKAQTIFDQYTRGEEILSEELQMKRADTTPFWVNLTVKVTQDANDNIIESRSIITDISDRRRAEAALRESEEKFRAVVETANKGICIVQDYNLKYVNRCLADLSGYSEKELFETNFAKFFPPDELEKVKAVYEKHIMGDKEPQNYDTVLRHKDGGGFTLISAQLSSSIRGGRLELRLSVTLPGVSWRKKSCCRPMPSLSNSTMWWLMI